MRTMRSRPPASSVSESKPPAFAVASIRCSSPHPRRADRRPPGWCRGCAASAVSEPSATYTVSPAAERTATLAGTPSNGIDSAGPVGVVLARVACRRGTRRPAQPAAGGKGLRSRPGDRTAPGLVDATTAATQCRRADGGGRDAADERQRGHDNEARTLPSIHRTDAQRREPSRIAYIPAMVGAGRCAARVDRVRAGRDRRARDVTADGARRVAASGRQRTRRRCAAAGLGDRRRPGCRGEDRASDAKWLATRRGRHGRCHGCGGRDRADPASRAALAAASSRRRRDAERRETRADPPGDAHIGG